MCKTLSGRDRRGRRPTRPRPAAHRHRLADVRPSEPTIPHVLRRLAAGGVLRVIVTEPYAETVRQVLGAMAKVPVEVQVTPWPVAGQSLAQIEAWVAGVRQKTPDLVLVAVPPDAVPHDPERFIRSYSWTLDLCLAFGRSEWDVVALLPSVGRPGHEPVPPQSPQAQADEETMRRIAIGHDLGIIQRPPADASPAGDLIAHWFEAQARGPATP